MSKLNVKGLLAGVVVWIAIMGYAVTQFACLKLNQCGGGDIFIAAVLGIGMIAPGYLVALLVSDISK